MHKNLRAQVRPPAYFDTAEEREDSADTIAQQFQNAAKIMMMEKCVPTQQAREISMRVRWAALSEWRKEYRKSKIVIREVRA